MMRRSALALAVVAAACGTDDAVEPDLPYPAKVTVSPEMIEIARFGEEVLLTAMVIDQHGDTMDAIPVIWASTDTTVASVDDQGRVLAWMTGTSRVVATVSDAITDTAVVAANFVQRDALIAIYDALDGPNWKDNENWGTRTELSTWHGVTTDGDGNPIRLVLRYNDLAGQIPSLELLKLEHLESLDLSFNENITGAIPPQLGDMKSLKRIFLHHNGLTGTIPEDLSKLNLDSLNVHANELTGAIPDWLGDQENLELLGVWSNSFTGGLPESIGNIDGLWYLSVRNNPLSGRLPRSLLNLDLGFFYWSDTNLCSPPDDEFQRWLDQIPTHWKGEPCDS